VPRPYPACSAPPCEGHAPRRSRGPRAAGGRRQVRPQRLISRPARWPGSWRSSGCPPRASPRSSTRTASSSCRRGCPSSSSASRLRSWPPRCPRGRRGRSGDGSETAGHPTPGGRVPLIRRLARHGVILMEVADNVKFRPAARVVAHRGSRWACGGLPPCRGPPGARTRRPVRRALQHLFRANSGLMRG
jgi:hypothetical protein